MTPQQKDKLRTLPAIGQLLEHEAVGELLECCPHSMVTNALQAAVDDARNTILSGGVLADSNEELADNLVAFAIEYLERRVQRSLRHVINATGVVLHTGLGRAPMCEAAVRAVVETASNYCNLELDLDTGTRGERTSHVADLLAELTGAEAATVVNNNAAATLLILTTIASDAEVIVSRGQLVEIGGSYRLPDVMAAGGAILREVGTTNRTRIADYERAMSEDTAALMRVHTSNYKVVGFTEETPLEQLVELGKKYGKIVIDDIGSGALFDLAALGLPDEPNVREAIATGADLVCFSGDKLLGGPQAGIIVGRRDLIARIEASPLMRTYRTDKMTLAALEATLKQYQDQQHAIQTIPTLASLAADEDALRKKAQRLVKKLRQALPEESFETVMATSVAGGGSAPAKEITTTAAAWTPRTLSTDQAQARLRQATPPVIARTANEQILFDPRTIQEKEIPNLIEAVESAASK